MEERIDLKTIASNDNIVNDDFKNDMEGIKLFISQKREFSFLEYHTDLKLKSVGDTDSTEFSLIKEIVIKNHTNNYYSDLKLTISFSNDTFSVNPILISSIDSQTDVKIKIPYIKNLVITILTEKTYKLYYILPYLHFVAHQYILFYL